MVARSGRTAVNDNAHTLPAYHLPAAPTFALFIPYASRNVPWFNRCSYLPVLIAWFVFVVTRIRTLVP